MKIIVSHLFLPCSISFDSTTGMFTVPSGGDGWYYFYIYLRVSRQEYGYFEIAVNDEPKCTAVGNMVDSGPDTQQATCGVVTSLVTGNHLVLTLFPPPHDIYIHTPTPLTD